MQQYPTLIDLAIVLSIALLAGLIARRMGQSALLAYLLAGVAIGPHVLGIIRNTTAVESLAEIGVALLMFTLGVEFSLRGLAAVQDFAVYGGIIQIILVTAIGFGAGTLMGLGSIQSAYLGCIVAISSTVIVFRVLQERGEAESVHGRALLGLLLVQDLAVVAMLGVLPLLPDFTLEHLPDLGASLLKAASFLVLVFVLARSWIPGALRLVAATGSKELFALTILAIVFGTALGTQAIGFSLAVGAFIAGLIVSESEFSHEVLAEVAPLRDIFAIVFFVSIGMLIDPSLLLRYWLPVIAIVAIIILGKVLVGTGVGLGFGYPFRPALLIGLGLTQIGELSFVIAREGLTHGGVSAPLYSIVLTSALITIVMTPPLLSIGPTLAQRISSAVDVDRYLGRRPEERPSTEPAPFSDHVIILGYGRVGRSIGAALERFGYRYVIVDFDLRQVEELRAVGVAAIYGEATHEEAIRRAHPETAALAVITLRDMLSTIISTRILLRINPQLRIIARVHVPEAVNALCAEGVDEVVEPEFEAGIEMMRHTLLRLGVPLTEVQGHAERIRQFRYPELAAAREKNPLEEIQGHYILCGYGRLGRQVSEELMRAGIPQVVIEVDADQIAPLSASGIPAILGNAHEESVLHRAAIERASGLVAATSSDAENLYITATARQLNPSIFVIARANRAEDEEKFSAAGANRVVYPYGIGAKSVALEILSPNVAAFLQTLVQEGAIDREIGEASIGGDSHLVGQTLASADIHQHTGATAIGIRTVEGDLVRNPSLQTMLRAGDVLIALGNREQLERLRILAESGPLEPPSTY